MRKTLLKHVTAACRAAAGGLVVGCLVWLSGPSTASADTTSWFVQSVEWMADAHDAILVLRARAPEGQALQDKYPNEIIREGKYPVETVEVLKGHPQAPSGQFILVKPSGDVPHPGDRLIVFYRLQKDELRPVEFINTSRPTELIHFPRDPERRKTYVFLGMDATAQVIETHDDMVRRLRERLQLKMPPISRETEMRVRMRWQQSPAGIEWRLADDYESYGYDVIIDLLIPFDRHVLDRLQARGEKYTTEPAHYLGYQGLVQLADAMAKGEADGKLPALTELAAQKKSPGVALAWARELARRTAREVRHLTPSAYGHAGQQRYLLSPDGTRLYQLETTGLTAMDVATGETLYRTGVYILPPTAQFSPDGHYLAWRTTDSVSAMDVLEGKVLFSDKRRSYDTSMMFTGNGQMLLYLLRHSDGVFHLTLRELGAKAETTELQLPQLEGRVALTDLGDTGRFAVIQQEEPREDHRGLLEPQLLVVDTLSGETILQMPRSIALAAVGANDRVITMLSAPRRGDADIEVRELTLRPLDAEDLLLQADIPARFERCVYLTGDLLAVCTAPDAPNQEALLFSIFNDSRRGEVLQWTP